MPPAFQLLVDRLQLRPHPFRDRDAPYPEPPVAGPRTNVREPQEVERFRFAQSSTSPIDGGTPPELDQPRLVRMQLQPELREPSTQLVQESPRVLLVFKPDDEVVRETYGDHIPAR